MRVAGNHARAIVLIAAPGGMLVAAGTLLGGMPGLAAALVIALGMNASACLLSARAALTAMHARPVSEVERPHVYGIIRELCTAARQPMPRLYISPAMQPNVFVTGFRRRNAVVCCTEGALRTLDSRELRAVLGHELSHVCNRDILVSSFAAGLATVMTLRGGVTRLARAESRPLWSFGSYAMMLLGLMAACAIQVAVSRAREYHADASSAALTGEPLALASALRKIEAGIAALPLPACGQFASAAHLMIASPLRRAGFARLFCTHPPTAERVLRLEAMAAYPW